MIAMTRAEKYAAGLIRRRTKAQLSHLRNVIRGILDASELQTTIRHLFYQIASLKLIEKTERDYNQLQHQLTKWRREGSIDWRKFIDPSRRFIELGAYS